MLNNLVEHPIKQHITAIALAAGLLAGMSALSACTPIDTDGNTVSDSATSTATTKLSTYPVKAGDSEISETQVDEALSEMFSSLSITDDDTEALPEEENNETEEGSTGIAEKKSTEDLFSQWCEDNGYKEETIKQAMTQQLTDDALLEKKAKDEGIVITDDDVEQAIQTGLYRGNDEANPDTTTPEEAISQGTTEKKRAYRAVLTNKVLGRMPNANADPQDLSEVIAENSDFAKQLTQESTKFVMVIMPSDFTQDNEIKQIMASGSSTDIIREVSTKFDDEQVVATVRYMGITPFIPQAVESVLGSMQEGQVSDVIQLEDEQKCYIKVIGKVKLDSIDADSIAKQDEEYRYIITQALTDKVRENQRSTMSQLRADAGLPTETITLTDESEEEGE